MIGQVLIEHRRAAGHDSETPCATVRHLAMLSTEPDWAPRGFKVEVSDDGKTWSAPIAQGKGTGTRTVASFEPVTTRHVRITQTGNAIERWLVSELELHGEVAR